MVAVACPVPTAVQSQACGQLGALSPEHFGGQLMGLGEGLGLVGGLGLVCLVAVDGGLAVGPLALSRLLAGERRLGQTAQRVAGRVGLVHGLPPDKGWATHGSSEASLTVGTARLGVAAVQTARP
jgi:hypothetical protein